MTRILLFFFLIVCWTASVAQDLHRFDDQLEAFKQEDASINREDVIVFTGSSSIRFWTSLSSDFPTYNIINRGFGGSHMSDLLYHCDALIGQYQPQKVFVYEGDNDIYDQENKESILREARQMVDKVWSVSPATEIYFIAAKPSVARWHLRSEYEQLNYALSLWALIKPKVHFVDIWTPMLGEDGEVMADLFLEDQLHMNAKGYAIWAEVMEPYLEKDVSQN